MTEKKGPTTHTIQSKQLPREPSPTQSIHRKSVIISQENDYTTINRPPKSPPRPARNSSSKFI